MSLQAIFDAVGARLQGLVGKDYPALLFVGPDDRDDQSRATRICWKPGTQATHQAPRRIGGGPGNDGPILTRIWVIEVEVWGASLAETEALVNAFLSAGHDVLTQNGYIPGGEAWRLGGTAGGQGVLCMIGFQLAVPIPRVPIPTVPMPAIALTTSLETSP